MDTLVIVRKIREAEALAESGKHRDAKRLLQPLLGQGGLTEAQQDLLNKKLEVIEKQIERATRVMSRRASESARRDPSDDTDLGSGRKPAAPALAAERPKSSGDTTVERPAIAPGTPTEAVPRPRDKDTTKLRKKPESDRPRAETPPERDFVSLYDNAESSPGGETTVRDRPAPPKPPSERRAAAPQADTEIPSRGASNRLKPTPGSELLKPAHNDLAPLHDEGADIRIVDIPLPSGAPTVELPKPAMPRTADSQEIEPVKDDGFDSDELPSLGEMAPPKPAGETRGVFRALPPKPPTDENPPPNAASLRVQDILIAPPAPAQVERQRSSRSSKDLTSLVERLPDDDLRKELALEVVRLREELEKVKSGRRDTDRTSAGSSRRIAPGEKPESSIFKIPSNRVNTIVRTAAGTSEITAHMPTRDEVVPELEVLRRESLKRQAGAAESAEVRLSPAQSYIENVKSREPDRLKLFATALGLLVIAGVVAWAIYWAATAMS